MTDPGHTVDWDASALGAAIDQIALFDAARRRCPVAFSETFGWSVFRHADVRRALDDPVTFSNAVSQHLAIPNGLDPPVHTIYRRMLDRYFAEERMAALEPACRGVAIGLLDNLATRAPVEVMAMLAEPYAVRAQCAFLHWPCEIHEPLLEWIRKNHAAVRARDRGAMAAVAFEFDGHIRGMLGAHRDSREGVAGPVVAELLGESVQGRPVTDEEIVSILRNWTVGELATISACIGIVADFLASRSALQAHLRANPALLTAAIDEILRVRAPLMMARRVVTFPVEIGGRRLNTGDRVTLVWASANRDEQAFESPEEFSLERDPGSNLLYGAGIHVCPGAPLARLVLRVLFEELLARFELESLPGQPPAHALYPAAGFSSVTLRLNPR